MQLVQEPMKAPLYLTAQTGNANGVDWQEEVYQKDFLHRHLTTEQIVQIKMFKMTLEHILCFLGLNKHDIQPAHKVKLLLVEKQIDFFLSPISCESLLLLQCRSNFSNLPCSFSNHNLLMVKLIIRCNPYRKISDPYSKIQTPCDSHSLSSVSSKCCRTSN
ncbi:hypothetical protein RDI58_010363 [Solanum bulbocastanum]|uniref:Uncharacterized protein n=1 Tax=Solanum bulbocastanum TaxID=147425 RepID=A0AAN8TTX0_SOLBU